MRPWADLPEPLAEAILEFLPLIDYIHFASVCKSWQSIHRAHRPRHSVPHGLPWFVSHHLHPRDDNNDNNEEEGGGFLESCSPLEKKHYRLPLPPDLRRSRDIYCYASCGGWLLISTSHKPQGCLSSSSNFILMEQLLFNPVTRATIPLPRLSTIPLNVVHRGALSAPPTDPECSVLFVDVSGSVFLHRLRDGGGSGWMRVGPALYCGLCSATACGGKFYCQYYTTGVVGVLNPLLPQPTMRFPFGWQALPPQVCCMVDNGGDACIVRAMKLDVCTIKELRVFRADLFRKQWVRVKNLGDRAIFVDGPMFVGDRIFVDQCFAFSFIAAELGLEKNTIYCSQYSSRSNDGLCWWRRAFNLDSRSWVEGTEVSYTYLNDGCHPWHNCWFLPTLDLVDTMQAGH